MASVSPRMSGVHSLLILSLLHSPPPCHFPSTPQSRLQTQLMALRAEMDEVKAQGTQMGAENGALTGVLGHKGVGRARGERNLEGS